MKRRTAREKALQTLFQIDVSNIDPKEAITHALDEQESDPFFSRNWFSVCLNKRTSLMT
ncbi:hypothetical protein BsIDN1_42540 [Bacillus safensis]|uniref:Uncharacterized protein n=1 Tax=Bacillus safensis TaxID=561879 RepID=A0A5S9MGA3_BACIA|nr:hypothetical protein BsIDN1_42540 [Bacillus safensis]